MSNPQTTKAEKVAQCGRIQKRIDSLPPEKRAFCLKILLISGHVTPERMQETLYIAETTA